MTIVKCANSHYLFCCAYFILLVSERGNEVLSQSNYAFFPGHPRALCLSCERIPFSEYSVASCILYEEALKSGLHGVA